MKAWWYSGRRLIETWMFVTKNRGPVACTTTLGRRPKKKDPAQEDGTPGLGLRDHCQGSRCVQFTRVQFCLEQISPPATQPDIFIALPLTEILPR